MRNILGRKNIFRTEDIRTGIEYIFFLKNCFCEFAVLRNIAMLLGSALNFLRRICNMQEKLFIQWGRFSFFFRPKLPTLFIQKQMTAVGLGQQGSRAVSSGFESLPCQIFLRFIPNIFRYPKLVKH